jgi:aspartate racemase
MKTIGLIGGMSWESTSLYYSIINEGVNKSLKKNHSAKCLIYSFDFQEIEDLQYKGEWNLLRDKIINAGIVLKNAGSDYVVLCTNTMHKVVDGFEEKVGIPLLDIADAVGQEIKNAKIRRVGLLGTIFTMEQDFYKSVLIKKYGLDVIVPDDSDRKTINSIIYDELVKGVVGSESRDKYYKIMDNLKKSGAEGMILGCTEIGLLVKDYSLPIFDSTKIHAELAVEKSLN